jgi:hypothetical protein
MLLTCFQGQLKAKGKSRQGIEGQDGWIVREGLNAYGAVFEPKNRAVRPYWGGFQGKIPMITVS